MANYETLETLVTNYFNIFFPQLLHNINNLFLRVDILSKETKIRRDKDGI